MQFEYLCGTSGTAGNLKGTIQDGGNPFEGARSRPYPTPAQKQGYGHVLFAEAAKQLGYKPFPQPSGNLSQAYTNPLGVKLGQCTFCGFCEWFGCANYSKASPQTTILPVLLRKSNFEARTECEVMRINLDRAGKWATGVTYVDSSGEEWEQPADLVLLCAFQLFNVQLLLLSGIGTPYDPQSGKGQIGRNFTHQTVSTAVGFFDKDKYNFNPFIASGSIGMCIDEFNGDNFDHGQLGFVGGGYIGQVRTNGRPLESMAVPPGTPAWGAKWKQALRDNYLSSVIVGAACHASFYSYRDVYLDLDPTYKDRFGRPLMRMTIDFHDNEIKMSAFLTDKYAEILQKMGAKQCRQETAQGALRRHRLSDVASVRRRHHGRQSGQQRAEQIFAELGRAQSFRPGRFRLPAECRLQPDRHGGGAGFLVGESDPFAISQKSGTARPCVTLASLPGVLCGLLLAMSAGGASADGIDKQDFKQIERGRYLSIVGDCAACHTLPGSGHELAGGRAIETPFGVILAPNITPDPSTGIGAWTDDEFINAMTKGTGRNGAHLYPAMPYTYYTKITRDDALAIRAYLNTVPAVQNPVEPNQLPFPFDIRAAMRVWNQLYFTPGTFLPNPNKSAEWNRGAYLAEGLGHCGLCHTPKTILGGDKTSERLQGYALQGWFAADITNDPRRGLGSWSVDDIANYLKTGHSQTSIATGLMAETIGRVDVAHERRRSQGDRDLSEGSIRPGRCQVDPARADQPAMKIGAKIYADECAGCHAANGKGSAGLFPPLAGSAIVQQIDPTSLLHVVLRGARSVATDRAPTASAMPQFAWLLKDDEVAAVLTYIRNSWGNAAPAVSAGEVGRARRAFVERTD